MSALRLEPIRKGSKGWCSNGCQGSAGVKAGTVRAYLASWPVGVLCRNCAKSWQAAWDGATLTLRIRVRPFPGVYILENPELVESAMFGPCLKGRFRLEDDSAGWDIGIFRLDRMELIEPMDEQLRVAA